MKNKELVVVGILLISLAFNYFTWTKLNETKNRLQEFAHKNEVYGLSNEISSLRNDLKEMKKQNEWIQEENFEVNKGKSTFNTIYLRGEWTFKELAEDQVPYLSLKENNEWIEMELEK